MSTHALTDRAMVMNLNIGVWQGYRLDKQASAEITAAKGANADAARVNKHLVPKELLRPIVTARNTIRVHFYENTLPWRDNGDRLMTRKLYMKFIQEHSELVTEFRDAVEQFLAEDYATAIEQAAFRMGELFNRDDYPPVSELRRRFYINLDIDAITTADDFRVEIDAEHVERVKASMEAAAESRVHAALQDVWRRMAETIGYFHQRMDDPKAVFRDSTVDNIAELIDLIPGLNVLDDPAIEEVRQMIDKRLTGIDANDIRKDPAFREELADEAKQIMTKVEGFMKAFGANPNEDQR